MSSVRVRFFKYFSDRKETIPLRRVSLSKTEFGSRIGSKDSSQLVRF